MDTPPPPQPPQFSNYPRGYPGMSPMGPFQKPPGVYFEAIGEAWKLVQQEMGTWVLASLIYLSAIIALQIVVRLVMFSGQLIPTNLDHIDLTGLIFGSLLSIMGSMVNVVLMTGMMRMGARQGQGLPISIGDVFGGFRRFGTVLATCFLAGLAYLIGFVLCIVPGIYMMGALVLAPIVAADQDVDAIEAITLTYRTVGSDAWLMFVLLFVAGIIQSLGVCLCGIGLLFTMPIYMITIGLHYNYYFPPQSQSPNPYVYSPPTMDR
jgi:hypothetical protein